MKNLIRNLKPYKGIAFIILLLTIGQAFCDLNLPQYTQDLIDIGIVNHGVEHILPIEIEADELDELMVHANDQQKDRLTEVYKLVEGEKRRTYTLSGELGKDDLAALDEEMLQPVLDRYIEKNKDSMTKKDFAEMQASIESASVMGNNETLIGTAIAYAVQCDEAAGVDTAKTQHDYMWKCGGIMLLMAFASLALVALISFLAARVGAHIGKDLRGRLFRNVISFSSAEIEQFQTSSLITRATNDIQQVQMTSTMMLRMMIYAPCVCTWSIIRVYQTHAQMNYIIIIGVVAILALMGLLLMVANPKFKIMQKLIDGLNAVSREMLTGIQVIRAFGREKTEEERFDKANNDVYRNQLFVARTMTLMMPVMMIVMYGLTVWITWVAAHRIDMGTIQVGAMTAFISYSMEIVFSFLMISSIFIFLPRAGVAADRIFEVIETETSVKDRTAASEMPDETRGEVCFDHVSFMYPDAEENVLTDISFTAKPGETTAIIGSTGCGKSTLINLIPRFYDVTEGSITIDGIDIRDVTLHSLREKIGYVPQKGILFSGTIDSNIKFGKPDATREEAIEAAELAQADEFIDTKEEGYDSFIAQGGSNVSGGQKQRLSIARALVKKPPVLIFDDSFSALDMKTDAELRKALADSASDSTKIIVAQRVGTILHAEQIIVLDDGMIVGKGTHEELLKNCEVYLEIAQSQLSSSELGL